MTLRLLLDTHALIWWMAGNAALPSRAQEHIALDTNPVYISAASAWELATKIRLGKLPAAERLMRDLSGALAQQGFLPLPISLRHAETAGALPGPHRDPFDRVLVAQAILEDLWLVSNECVFDVYGIRRLWD